MFTSTSVGLRLGVMPSLYRFNYFVTVGLTVTALVITFLLLRVDGAAFYSFLLIAVVVSAAVAGLKAALLALLLSVLTSISLLVGVPATAHGQHDLLRLAFFVLSALSASFVVDLLRKSRARVQAAEQKLALGVDAAALKIVEWKIPTSGVRLCFDCQQFAIALSPTSASDLVSALEEAVGGNGHFDCEVETKTLSGLPEWLLFKGRVERKSANDTRVIGAIVDITAHKQAEEARRRSIELEANAKITSSLAHEINNPLCSLMFTLYLLQTSAGPMAENWRDLLACAQAELCRVSALTQKILSSAQETEPIGGAEEPYAATH